MNTTISPGFYRLRDGSIGEVVYQRGNTWYGHHMSEIDGELRPACAMRWNKNGGWNYCHRETDWDIIGPAEVTISIRGAA